MFIIKWLRKQYGVISRLLFCLLEELVEISPLSGSKYCAPFLFKCDLLR